jgi:hypothetical protein
MTRDEIAAEAVDRAEQDFDPHENPYGYGHACAIHAIDLARAEAVRVAREAEDRCHRLECEQEDHRTNEIALHGHGAFIARDIATAIDSALGGE